MRNAGQRIDITTKKHCVTQKSAFSIYWPTPSPIFDNISKPSSPSVRQYYSCKSYRISQNDEELINLGYHAEENSLVREAEPLYFVDYDILSDHTNSGSGFSDNLVVEDLECLDEWEKLLNTVVS
ncbi:hypothetical protein XU18_3938 [Perkinsela sp. CCAP 1560/4]|nr:hypothetical protein XU18_3938 [Perkinsela sp. CCAP 1560/4]|eukprot:KNH04954.1 hypothetical protein XU18_3938 [Perkinsela sp. CCAP 1560/4]